MECKFCKREAKTAQSFRQHEIRCSNNPNKITPSPGMTGKKGSNHFMKAAELGLPIPQMSAETKNKLRILNTGKKASLETRKKISDSRKRFLDENPDSIPYRLNHSSKQSYPEKYFSQCFSNLNVKEEHKVKRYSLDFANLITKRYVEIDGEQHHVDKRIVAHDIKRNACLTEMGWESKRIRWKDFSKLHREERRLIVNSIIEFLK